MSDWQVGDLALCVDARDDIFDASGLREGVVYTISSIFAGRRGDCFLYPDETLGFHVVEIVAPSGRWFASSRFRKIRPDEREACEPEFVTLLQRIKRKRQVTAGCHTHTATITFTPGPATQWLLRVAEQLKQEARDER